MNWNHIQKKIVTENQNGRRRIEFVEAKIQSPSTKTLLSPSATQNTKTSTGPPQKKKNSEGIYSQISILKYSKWDNIRRAGPGMFNHGNTCFLNSTLQCLVHTAPLVQSLMQDPNAIRGFGGKQQDGQNTAILLLFKRLLEDVWASTSPKAVSPRMMVNTIRRISRQFRPYQQEDAHEYLRQLLDTMNNEILKINHLPIYGGQANPPAPGTVNLYDTTLISRIFTGKLCNILSCNKCKYRSKTWNSFQDISLNIGSGVKSVQDAVNLFIKPEKLEAGNEWLCDGCKRKVQASKQMTISAAPIVLVLHLKRFSFGNMFDKIKKHIDFPLNYELPILTEANERTRISYELYGIIVHHGHSVNSGHYIAYVKASNGQWYEMDDSSVSQVSINTVLKQQAYILFYLQTNVKGGESVPESKTPEQKPQREADQIGSEIDEFKESNPKRKMEDQKKPLQVPSVQSHQDSDEDDEIDVTGITEALKNKTIQPDSSPAQPLNDLDKPTRLPSRRFGIFRFTGKIGKFRQWIRKPPTHSIDNIIPEDWIVPDSDDESSEESDEPSGQISPNDESENDSEEIQQPATKKSTKQDLIKLSMRGRDVGGEGIWDDPMGKSSSIIPKVVLESIQSTEKAIRRSEQKESQKKKPSEWDAMLDSGRQKKIKTGRPNSLEVFLKEGDKENKFQKYQNHIRDSSGGEKEFYLQQWGNIKKDRSQNTEEDEWNDPKRTQMLNSKGFQKDQRGYSGRGSFRGGMRGRGNRGGGGMRGRGRNSSR